MTQVRSDVRAAVRRRRKRIREDGWERYNNPTELVSMYRRFPATFMVMAPYVLLIVPPAVAYGNLGVWFLIGVALIAIAGTSIPEFLGRAPKGVAIPTENVHEYGKNLFRLAIFAISVGSVIHAAAAFEGKGSIAAQAGLVEASSGLVGAIDSSTKGWVIVGVGLLFAAYVGGQCSRKGMFLTLSIAVVAELMASYFTQITAPLLELVTFLSMMALLLGVVRARVVLIGALITLVIWPTVFEFRNELRASEGVWVSDEVTAFDRLRFDLQFADAQEIQVPLDVDVPGILQHPTLIDILRFGLIPRFLDPDRDQVSTGVVVNVALGGARTSARTFGPVTTLYVLEGPLYLFLYYFALSVYVSLLWRRGTRVTPIRLGLLALAMDGPLGWFSTFPDATIGMVQGAISAIPLFACLLMFRRSEQKKRNR